MTILIISAGLFAMGLYGVLVRRDIIACVRTWHEARTTARQRKSPVIRRDA